MKSMISSTNHLWNRTNSQKSESSYSSSSSSNRIGERKVTMLRSGSLSNLAVDGNRRMSPRLDSSTLGIIKNDSTLYTRSESATRSSSNVSNVSPPASPRLGAESPSTTENEPPSFENEFPTLAPNNPPTPRSPSSPTQWKSPSRTQSPPILWAKQGSLRGSNTNTITTTTSSSSSLLSSTTNTEKEDGLEDIETLKALIPKTVLKTDKKIGKKSNKVKKNFLEYIYTYICRINF